MIKKCLDDNRWNHVLALLDKTTKNGVRHVWRVQSALDHEETVPFYLCVYFFQNMTININYFIANLLFLLGYKKFTLQFFFSSDTFEMAEV